LASKQNDVYFSRWFELFLRTTITCLHLMIKHEYINLLGCLIHLQEKRPSVRKYHRI